MQTTPLLRILLMLEMGCLACAVSPQKSTAQVHSLDYATPAYIDFESVEIIVRENQSVAVANVYRTGDFRQYSRFSFATKEDTATEGKDYKGVGGTITFQPGEGLKQIEIPVLADDEAESDETFHLVLSDPNANTVLLRTSAVVRIQDSPATALPPMLNIAAEEPGKISLSWEGSPNYAIERTADPGNAHWEAVTCSPEVSGNRCQVVQPAGGILYVYRLRAE